MCLDSRPGPHSYTGCFRARITRPLRPTDAATIQRRAAVRKRQRRTPARRRFHGALWRQTRHRSFVPRFARHSMALTAGPSAARTTTMGVHFASFIFSSGRSPPLIRHGVRCRDTSIRTRGPLHLQTETGARPRHRGSPNQARATNAGSVLQLTAVRSVGTSRPPTAQAPASL